MAHVNVTTIASICFVLAIRITISTAVIAAAGNMVITIVASIVTGIGIVVIITSIPKPPTLNRTS